jgi:hypothetical protein
MVRVPWLPLSITVSTKFGSDPDMGFLSLCVTPSVVRAPGAGDLAVLRGSGAASRRSAAHF